MKWIVVLSLVLLGYVAAGPFITIYQMKSAVERHDSEALSSCVDFPSLRTNLKDQFNALMLKTAAHELKDNPFGALGMALASTLVESMVNSFITPAGLANLMAGQKPQPDSDRNAEDVHQAVSSTPQQPPIGEETRGSNGARREPFKNARYSYDSPSKFSAWVQNDDGQEIRFVFTRDGVSWKLSNIVIPAPPDTEPTISGAGSSSISGSAGSMTTDSSAAMPIAAMRAASAPALPPDKRSPSFDCENAHSKSEHLICADTELADLDVDLSNLYNQAKSLAPDRAAFVRANRTEWHKREDACVDKACLVDWYANRRLQLSRVIADAAIIHQASSASEAISAPSSSGAPLSLPSPEAEAADISPKEHENIPKTVDSSGQLASWEAQIQARIQRAWLRPPTARAGIDCTVYVTQIPGGEVINARLGTCNGDAAARQSIQAAVFRASPLPAPPDPALFERNLEIQFKPVD